jgi:hypothetical protein
VPLVHRAHESGLVLAEESADEAGLGRALKQIDRRYILQKNPDGDQPDLYVVSCIVNEDEPPIRILAWADDDGTPRPLSSGLVDEVKKWRPEARNRRGPDADERNRQHRERVERERQEQLAEVTADHKARVSKGRRSVSMGPRTSKRYWQRNRKPPQSGLGGR